jgi:hypothetical protein
MVTIQNPTCGTAYALLLDGRAITCTLDPHEGGDHESHPADTLESYVWAGEAVASGTRGVQPPRGCGQPPPRVGA